MPAVKQYKIGVLRQLLRLEAMGRNPILPLQATPSDVAIRAVAELETDGIVVFEDASMACRLTGFGSRQAAALIRELQTKQKRK